MTDTRRNCSRDDVVDQTFGGATTVSAGGVVIKLYKCDVRGDMRRTLCHNLGRFRAASADVALAAEKFKCGLHCPI